MRELDSMDYVFINSDKTIRASLFSNPHREDMLDLKVYGYHYRGSDRQDTPACSRVNHPNENDVRNRAIIQHNI